MRDAGRGRWTRLDGVRAILASPAADRQLRPDDRLEAGLFRREMKARRAVDAVAIEQRQRRIARAPPRAR